MTSKINLKKKKQASGPVAVGSVIRDTNGRYLVWDGAEWIPSNVRGTPIPITEKEQDENNFDRAMDGV